jgi:hypothetical protein
MISGFGMRILEVNPWQFAGKALFAPDLSFLRKQSLTRPRCGESIFLNFLDSRFRGSYDEWGTSIRNPKL